jgi:AP-2 complex subunit alpha
MKIIFGSLRDNDISIRRRALDLIFLICTNESSKLICKELLSYFQEDEPQLKEDVALKIAILAEKYANDLVWYTDTCLKMLEVAGDYVTEDVAFRFIQIITGFGDQEPNTQLQLYAADKVFKLLEKEFVFDNVIKLAAYILGEFGHFLAQSSNFI